MNPLDDVNVQRAHAARDIDEALDAQQAWDLFSLHIWQKGLQDRVLQLAQLTKSSFEFGVAQVNVVNLPSLPGQQAPDAILVSIEIEGTFDAAAIQINDASGVFHPLPRSMANPPGLARMDTSVVGDTIKQLIARWSLIKRNYPLPSEQTHA